MNDIDWKTSILATLSLFNILALCFLLTILIFKNQFLGFCIVVGVPVVSTLIFKRKSIFRGKK